MRCDVGETLMGFKYSPNAVVSTTTGSPKASMQNAAKTLTLEM
jgi:hypothetical protein